MGSTFVNIQVHARDPETRARLDGVGACLRRVLREDGFLPAEAEQAIDRTILVATGPNWIGVYDELCDEQRQDVAQRLASELSRQLETDVVTILVHDSDVLWLELFVTELCSMASTTIRTTLARSARMSESLCSAGQSSGAPCSRRAPLPRRCALSGASGSCSRRTRCKKPRRCSVSMRTRLGLVSGTCSRVMPSSAILRSSGLIFGTPCVRRTRSALKGRRGSNSTAARARMSLQWVVPGNSAPAPYATWAALGAGCR